jgi:hypothetical protein
MSKMKRSPDTGRFEALPPKTRQAAIDVTSSPENARHFLRSNGFITNKDKLSGTYKKK